MATTSLAEKLGIKEGQHILLLRAPDGYRERLEPLPEGVEVAEQPKDSYDVVQLFAKDKATLDRAAPVAIQALKPDGRLWIAFPKGNAKDKQGLTRDVGWETVANAGMGATTLIALDDVWSAFRFQRQARASEQDLLAQQYAGAKAGLRPIYERIVEVARQWLDVRFETRNTYVALLRKRQFCTIQPATRTRIDLGLKLHSITPTERLQAATGTSSGAMTHRVVLSAVEDVDDEVIGWIRIAYEQSQ
ncbi:MAG: hypothetical protein H0X37_06600 [Herpetosiphonaceae bacterium]|nr:hypothetical protein [Herpetosiphonaceae bacterium]